MTRQSGFLTKFAQGAVFGRFSKLYESARQAPHPLMGFDASFNQKDFLLDIRDDQAGRGHRVFIYRLIALAAKQPDSIFVVFSAKSETTIWTELFGLHGASCMPEYLTKIYHYQKYTLLI